jgi:hypothetical protein
MAEEGATLVAAATVAAPVAEALVVEVAADAVRLRPTQYFNVERALGPFLSLLRS